MTNAHLSLSARTDRRFIRSTYRSNRFVLAEITAPPAPPVHEGESRHRPPVNICFVVDRSGSMAGDKIRLAKLAVEQSIARLAPTDRFAVVTYDNYIDVVFESALATTQAKADAMRALSMVDARGSTNLGEGWLRGCEQVARYLSSDGVNRCLLLTDGLANQGMTDRDKLAGHATALRARGVSTTTFGVGADFDELLLEAMATAGGGNFYFIADERQIVDYITSEVGEALDVVARDVALEIVAPDDVNVESLSPFPFASVGGGRTVVSIGSLVAGQVVEVLLRLNFAYGEVGRETGVVLGVSGASVSLEWEYASGTTNDGQPRDIVVDRAVARVFAARARQEAAALNRRGDFAGAQKALAGVAQRIRTYAGKDSEMRQVVTDLESVSAQVAAPMPAMALKEMHFASYAAARSRDATGKAIRGKN